MGWLNADRQNSLLPSKIVQAKTAIQNLTKTVQSATNEVLVMRKGLNLEPDRPKSLGNLPLIVITAGKKNKEKALGSIKEGKLEEKLQKEIVALSSNSKHIIAHESGHYIMYDQPELVVSEIISLMVEAK